MAAMVPLIVCLRLAVLLHRRREDIDAVPKLTLKNNDYMLSFRKKWLKDHPLTQSSLELEEDYYESLGVSLHFD